MRLERLDILRGIAILLMVFFHLNYSLVYIFGVEPLNFSELFCYIVGRISALGFISIAGISFFLAEKKYGKNIWKRYWKYSLILSFIAACISLGTYYFLPEQYIRFGILHFFALSFFLLPFFARLKYWNIAIALAVIIYGMFMIPIISSQYFYFIGFLYPGFSSADYYPIFPYFGVLLLGYSFGLVLERYKKLSIFQSHGEQNFLGKFLKFAGKNSLLIYLVHQPIIVAFIYFCNFILKKI